jgi:glutaredoxin 2
MKLASLLTILFSAKVTQAWITCGIPTSQTGKYLSSLHLVSTAETAAYAKPERVVLDDLPTLYVYDHCPFCVRVRIALGIKNVKHLLYFMANDDIGTPTDLVGKKIAPIFNFPEDDITMAESMDIIELVDLDERFGPTNMIRPASGRTDLKEWQKSVQSLLRTLQRPRYVGTGLIPEFQQLDARHAFIKNHQLPPFDKAEWKEMEMQEKLEIYGEAMASDPAPLVEELNAKLVELDDKLFSENYCTEGGLSLDDVDLFARLRSITIVKGVQWPKGLRTYMDTMSELSDIPLYDEMAM